MWYRHMQTPGPRTARLTRGKSSSPWRAERRWRRPGTQDTDWQSVDRYPDAMLCRHLYTWTHRPTLNRKSVGVGVRKVAGIEVLNIHKYLIPQWLHNGSTILTLCYFFNTFPCSLSYCHQNFKCLASAKRLCDCKVCCAYVREVHCAVVRTLFQTWRYTAVMTKVAVSCGMKMSTVLHLLLS